jgi:hypothetical protein
MHQVMVKRLSFGFAGFDRTSVGATADSFMSDICERAWN